ncbi:uncharacterized protein LOC108510788 [Phoenix dactylifera]|uniref:Uncharacterized protein LOC108510788 n=1 Tax=Phoenix dactylifera TaxID=42345 RepID=A0A8B8ZLS7_PHODC|nr:uncharacterized protein LOC108510788 [Phoenix dactylifera]
MPANLLPKLPQILFVSAFFTTVYAPYWESKNTWYECSTDSNYTTNSTYHSNLNLLLPSLSSATLSTGFATLSKGHPPDQVFGLASCRGDVSQDECQSCLSTADGNLLQLCPSGKSAAIWPASCFLRYSNRSFSSSSSDDNSFREILYNVGNVSKPTRFVDLVRELLNNLTQRAAYQSARMFATGEAKFMTSTTLYGLVQCTRDQSGDDCYRCLTVSAGYIPIYSWAKQGGAVLAYNCFMRFEIYSFYDESVGAAPPPPPSADTVSPPPEAITRPGKEGGKKNNAVMIVLPVVSMVGLLMVFSAIFVCLRRRRKFTTLFRNPATGDEENKNDGSVLLDLSTLRTATNDFSDTHKLGQGGFGPVYRGVLPNGQEIAVKRLSACSGQGVLEFKNEVVCLAKLQHKNLVRLLGCCIEQEERLLVYEFQHNTSLDKFLFDPMKNRLLDWGRRYKIIEGIARGLLYLHQDSQLKIIHRDLKTNNILLDQYMNPKISDFGLAKLFDEDKTRGTASRIAGTFGYMAPEYAMHGHFSTKSDVFSFGVLVLEIVTGQRINDFQGSGRAPNLLSYAWEHWNKGKALDVMDRSLHDQYDRQEASRCIHMGLLCVQQDQTKRPSMESIVLMLSSHSVTVSAPSMPAFFVQGSATTEPDVASGNRKSNPPKRKSSYQHEDKANSVSKNDVTISDMEPQVPWISVVIKQLYYAVFSISRPVFAPPAGTSSLQTRSFTRQARKSRQSTRRVSFHRLRQSLLSTPTYSGQGPGDPDSDEDSAPHNIHHLRFLSTPSDDTIASNLPMPANLLPKLPQILFVSALFTTVYASENTWYECSTDSNYTTNSTYHSNLNLLLPSLSSATLSSGFATLSKGHPPDRVFGLASCRGDVSQDTCQSCLSTADGDLLRLCPSGKSAAIWPESCFLGYSNRSFSSSSSDDNSFGELLCNDRNVSEPRRFENLVRELLDNLTERAAYQSALMFATGEAKFTTLTTLYGLVQCTRDQSGDDCYRCLMVSAGYIPNSCWAKQGGRVWAYNCIMRFEIYPFYNESVGAAPPPPPSDDTVSPPPEASTRPGKEGGKKNNAVMIVLPVVSMVGMLMVFSAIFVCLRRRRKFTTLFRNPATGDEENKNDGSLLLDLSTLTTATNDFSDKHKLGEGGFGPVYRGVLPNGQEIAVKRLSASSGQGVMEFKNEVVCLAKLQHKNFVRLLGCCIEQEERLLVYEFQHNTSLDKFLFDPMKNRLLDWGRRYKIIEGNARGLLYLHQESQLKIIHRDLKTNNILLYQYMNPKISDFGLAKLFDEDKTRGTASRIAGTNGYMAPEYAMHGHFSTKSDVFSFGVLVLEIVIGRRINDFQGSGRAPNLLSYAWEHWNKGKALHVMDRSLHDQYDRQEASRCIHMGLLCVQQDQAKRPSMELVVLMLCTHSVTVCAPSVPAFFVEVSATTEPDVASRNRKSNPPKRKSSYQREEKSNSVSKNDVTISDMEPR